MPSLITLSRPHTNHTPPLSIEHPYTAPFKLNIFNSITGQFALASLRHLLHRTGLLYHKDRLCCCSAIVIKRLTHRMPNPSTGPQTTSIPSTSSANVLNSSCRVSITAHSSTLHIPTCTRHIRIMPVGQEGPHGPRGTITATSRSRYGLCR